MGADGVQLSPVCRADEEGIFAALQQSAFFLQLLDKPFTLDGRLVGNIGEGVASLAYKLTLNEGLTKHHDAV